jgi:hypothetical protein
MIYLYAAGSLGPRLKLLNTPPLVKSGRDGRPWLTAYRNHYIARHVSHPAFRRVV